MVTGASRGLGRAIARRLAREGAAVWVNYVARSGDAEHVVEQEHTVDAGVVRAPRNLQGGIGVMAELMTKDAEGTGRVAEASGDLERRTAFDEGGAKGLVLSVQWVFGSEEEVGQGR